MIFLMQISTVEKSIGLSIKCFASNIHVRCQLNGRSATSAHASSARAFKLATFVVSQFDGNAIAKAANELKDMLVRAGDFVHVMPQRGNYADRVVVRPQYTTIRSSRYF